MARNAEGRSLEEVRRHTASSLSLVSCIPSISITSSEEEAPEMPTFSAKDGQQRTRPDVPLPLFDGKGKKTNKPTKLSASRALVFRALSMPILSDENSESSIELNLIRSRDDINLDNLSEGGHKQLKQLLNYLHSEDSLVVFKQELDEEDIKLKNSLNRSVDLNKYFESETRDESKSGFWKKRIDDFNLRKDKNRSEIQNENQDKELGSPSCPVVDQVSANGYRLVRRFGYGIPDGCVFPLSLRASEVENAARPRKVRKWKEIVDDADDTLNQFEALRNQTKRNNSYLLQPRVFSVVPHPDTGWEKVWQIGHCLPLRRCTSDLFLESPSSEEMFDKKVKHNLKWNASHQDLRHLPSPDANRFGLGSGLEAGKSRGAVPVAFRRRSLDQSIWSMGDLMEQRKVYYEERLSITRCQAYLAEERGSIDSSCDSVFSTTTASSGSQTGKWQVEPHSGKQRLRTRFPRFPLGSDDILKVTYIECLNPQTIAKELTAIETELFLALNPTEISRLILNPHSVDQENCGDITALLGFEKRIVKLFTTSVLKQVTPEARAKKVALFVEVAEHLKYLRNWHSLQAVIASLQSPPVARLTRTWKHLSHDYADHYCEFVTLSEAVKKDLFDGHLDYGAPSLPLFDDFLDQLKLRCVLKADQLKQSKCHWGRSETIAHWVSGEVETLESFANKHTKASGTSSKAKAQQLMRRQHSVRSDLCAQTSFNLRPTRSVPEMTDDVEHPPALKIGEWPAFNLPNIKSDEEKEMLQEIARGLKEFQDKAAIYQFDDEESEATRSFLLFEPYESMAENMKRSFLLESPIGC